MQVFKKNDHRTIFNLVYRDGQKGPYYIKRFGVTSCTRDREYDVTQGKPGSRVMYFTANPNGEAEVIKVTLDPDIRKKRQNIFKEVDFSDILIKGRGAQGNPWIFREILAALEDREIPARPNRRELYEMIVRHAQLSCTYKGEYITVREMRKHLAWYTTGLPHAAGLRRQINSMETMEELMEGMKLLLEA